MLSNAPSQVFDNDIAEKWKEEMLNTEGHSVTQAMADWIIEELRYKAGIFQETGAVSVYNGDVVKSDTSVPLELKESLRSRVSVLENVPEVYKDYHPGSDGMVLDLVHPSLFPLVYGHSRVLKNSLIGLEECIEHIGKGEALPIPLDEETVYVHQWNNTSSQRAPPFSKNFQWLPCEVEFTTDGCSRHGYLLLKDVKSSLADVFPLRIVSYINNLHPQKHQELYAVIEQLIDRTIPLWNMTLTPLKARHWKLNRVPFDGPTYDPDPETIPDEDCPPQRDDEDEDEYYERMWEWKETQRVVVQPDAEKFQLPSVRQHMEAEYLDPVTRGLKEEMKVNLKRDYRERGLQVIVKLANIELTPEKPEYEGGSWHIEGQLVIHLRFLSRD